MSVSIKTLGIDRLNVDERLALVEEVWATICADAKAFPLTDEQRAELDRRVADDDSFPEDVVPWDEGVKVTLALSKRRVEFFKAQAQKHNTQYQRMRAPALYSTRPL